MGSCAGTPKQDNEYHNIATNDTDKTTKIHVLKFKDTNPNELISENTITIKYSNISNIDCVKSPSLTIYTDHNYTNNWIIDDNTTHLTPIQYFKQNNVTINKLSTTSDNIFWISNIDNVYQQADKNTFVLFNESAKSIINQDGVAVGCKKYRSKHWHSSISIMNLRDIIDIQSASGIGRSTTHFFALCHIGIHRKVIIRHWYKNGVPMGISDLICSYESYHGIESAVYTTTLPHKIWWPERTKIWNELIMEKNQSVLRSDIFITKMACGPYECLFVDSNGCVWYYDHNDIDRCNRYRIYRNKYFTEHGIKIIDVGCAGSTRFALSDDGYVYIWCCVGPQIIDALSEYNIIHIECKFGFLYAQSEHNQHFIITNISKFQTWAQWQGIGCVHLNDLVTKDNTIKSVHLGLEKVFIVLSNH